MFRKIHMWRTIGKYMSIENRFDCEICAADDKLFLNGHEKNTMDLPHFLRFAQAQQKLLRKTPHTAREI